MKSPHRHKELETILVLVLATGLAYWHYKKPVFLVIALITGAAGLFIPVAARLIHFLWMKLAEGLGFITSKLLLTVIFVAIVIPLGWITGKLGKSSIKLKPGGISYFKTRDHLFSKEDMENPW